MNLYPNRSVYLAAVCSLIFLLLLIQATAQGRGSPDRGPDRGQVEYSRSTYAPIGHRVQTLPSAH